MASIKRNRPVRMNASMAFVLLPQHLLVMRHPCCTGGCGGCSCLCGMVVPWGMLQGDVQCQQQDSIYMADHSRTFDQVACQWLRSSNALMQVVSLEAREQQRSLDSMTAVSITSYALGHSSFFRCRHHGPVGDF